MSSPREAMQMALEALELAAMNGSGGLYRDELRQIADAITALRAALSAQQEPVMEPRQSPCNVPGLCAKMNRKCDVCDPLPANSIKLPEAAQPVAPAGWKLVPVEPTREMMHAAFEVQLDQSDWLRLRYRAMLAAAPNAPTAQPLTDEQIASGMESHGIHGFGPRGTAFLDGVRFAERAHGIGVS